MVKILTSKREVEATGKRLVMDHSARFNHRTMAEGLTDEDMWLIYGIEHLKGIDGYGLLTQHDIWIDVSNISGGTKALINLRHFVRNPKNFEKEIFDLTDCGKNILWWALQIADWNNLEIVLTHSSIPNLPNLEAEVCGERTKGTLQLVGKLIERSGHWLDTDI